MPGPYLPGFAAPITVNGSPAAVSGWDVKDEVDLYDVTDTSCNGIQALIAGIKRGTASFTLWFGGGLSIVSGQQATISFATGDTLTCRIKSAGKKMVINGAVSMQVEAQQSCV